MDMLTVYQRILYMPLIYGIINWLAYRFIHQYVYLSLIYVVYEVFALAAFLYLMIQYVSNAAATDSIEEALVKKDKARLPAPWCCFRYRPTKSYFMHMVKWLVLQFIIIRPVVTVISIILHGLDMLCPSKMSPSHPNLWLTIFDILSMIIAMYGLILFYKLTRKELDGHRPLLKFLIIKGIVAITVTQEFILKILYSSDKIKPSEDLPAVEVADSLNAFLLSIEMAGAAVAMLWAFSASEYSNPERPRGTVAQAIVDSVNFGDFISEMKLSLAFFWYRRQSRSNRTTEEPLAALKYHGSSVGGAAASRASSINLESGWSSKNETRIAVVPV
ncbi:Transmembrane protein 184 homolog DDB_G0276041 [Rhizoctonia solani AG-1 IB]|uniref:Transmembrane protein 184 homolog DDB_G0276041 n=1 Tax=Thanatephorus cucumeris (strain AG1-IB / isolate 7/3/14) TaxID=1108050 RepID=M5C1C4_THACB|nr:Transmembrane protein 184 homolog DDB_G0276041 [Rhizoctonia solani AG-1 IB]